MQSNELIPIERRDGVTLYGRVIDGKAKLGQYEVGSEVLGNNGTVYPLYADAEKRMSALIGVQKDYEKGK